MPTRQTWVCVSFLVIAYASCFCGAVQLSSDKLGTLEGVALEAVAVPMPPLVVTCSSPSVAMCHFVVWMLLLRKSCAPMHSAFPGGWSAIAIVLALPSAFASSTGWIEANGYAIDTSLGDTSWGNQGNGYRDTGNAATIVDFTRNEESHSYCANDYRMPVPGDALVTGVEMRVTWQKMVAGAGNMMRRSIRLNMGTGFQYSAADYGDDSAISTSKTTNVYPSSHGLWGEASISPAQVTSSEFGGCIRVRHGDSCCSYTAYLHAISVQVHYRAYCPAVATNGVVSWNHAYEDDIIFGDCDIGYEGAPSRTCLPSGWGEVVGTCTNIDGCVGNPCRGGGDVLATCADVPAPGTGAVCTCSPGYSDEGNICIANACPAISELLNTTEPFNTTCVNGTYSGGSCLITCTGAGRYGSFISTCFAGNWSSTFLECSSIDYCATDPCGPSAVCLNSPDGHECSCVADHYMEDGACTRFTCSAISLGIGVEVKSGCEDNAFTGTTCTVKCSSGYTAVSGQGEGTCVSSGVTAAYTVSLACADTDECARDTCTAGGDLSAECSDVLAPGDGVICTCSSGFEAVLGVCKDIDECSEDVCAVDEMCINTAGSFVCTCPAPSTRDCNGTCDGTAAADSCGNCAGGLTGISPDPSCGDDDQGEDGNAQIVPSVPGPNTGEGAGSAPAIIGALVGALLCVVIAAVFVAVLSRKQSKGARDYAGDEESTVVLDLGSVKSSPVQKLLDASGTKKIGGGMAANVYRAKLDGEPVAIKKLKSYTDASLAEFHNEVTILSRISTVAHPNILSLKMYSNEPAAIVTELAVHGSLADWIASAHSSDIPVDVIKRTLSEITCGLVFLHNQHVAHRDVKERNILVCGDELTMKLADFGASETMAEDGMGTVSSRFNGTVLYSPPECFKVGLSIDLAKADVFAVGVVAWRLTANYRGSTSKNASHSPADLAELYKSTVPSHADMRKRFPLESHFDATLSAVVTGATSPVVSERPTASGLLAWLGDDEVTVTFNTAQSSESMLSLPSLPVLTSANASTANVSDETNSACAGPL